MNWAKRFGGPATGFFAPSRGAITVCAAQPTGLSFGPVSTRAQNPYTSGINSHYHSVARISTTVTRTTPATTRAAFSLTGLRTESNPRADQEHNLPVQ